MVESLCISRWTWLSMLLPDENFANVAECDSFSRCFTMTSQAFHSAMTFWYRRAMSSSTCRQTDKTLKCWSSLKDSIKNEWKPEGKNESKCNVSNQKPEGSWSPLARAQITVKCHDWNSMMLHRKSQLGIYCREQTITVDARKDSYRHLYTLSTVPWCCSGKNHRCHWLWNLTQ